MKMKVWLMSLMYSLVLISGCKMGPIGSTTAGVSYNDTPAAAANFVNAQNLTAKYLDVTGRLTSVSDKYALAAILQEMKQNYDSYPPDLQFVAAFFIPMAQLQSIFYRFDGIFQQSGQGDNSTHSFYINAIKALGTGINTFLPNNNWAAGFAYFTEPLQGADATNTPFVQFRDFQNFLTTAMLPELNTMYQRIANNPLSYGADKPGQLPPAGNIVFDNKVLYGTIINGGNTIDPFPNNLDRFVLIGDAERKAVLASISLAMHNLLVTTALNLDSVLDFNESMAKAFGYDTDMASFANIEGFTSQKRAQIAQSYATNNQLFAVVNQQNLTQAFTHLQDAVNQANAAWSLVKSRQVNDVGAQQDTMQNFFALNPARLIPWSRMTNAAFSNLTNMINNDQAVIRSEVTGEVTTVNLKKLYTNPPANLTAFLPTSFNTQAQKTEGALTYRNYQSGTALQWNYNVYVNYFPQLQPATDNPAAADIRPTVRIVAQSWGGWMVAGPMVLAL